MTPNDSAGSAQTGDGGAGDDTSMGETVDERDDQRNDERDGREDGSEADVEDSIQEDGIEADVSEVTTLATGRTRRWYGVGGLALLALGVGVLTGAAPPLLAGVFGLAFAGYGELTTPPTPDVTVERTVDPTESGPGTASALVPGDEIHVTVTITNEGRWPLFDLRVVDDVPRRLGVTKGTPRHTAVLRAGASTTFSYAVCAERGEHTFGRTTLITRDVAGGAERVVAAGEATTVRCPPKFPAEPPAIPLRAKVSQFTGRFAGDTGGPGVEFHATRRYRRGDPLSRVDWRRIARTGELTTVEFRVERTVRVCLVFDVRDEAHLAPEPHAPSAVERSVEGAIAAYASLTEEGHDVGIATIGPTDCWLAPGSGDRHRTATRHLFATHPALSPVAPDAETNIYQTTQRLKGRLAGDQQVLLFSPLCDDRILAAAIRLDAHGYPVTVISPDPTNDETTGQTYARIRRRLRIADLRSRSIPVVDWTAGEKLGTAIARTGRRWSR